jgi:hypothetical protein
MSQRSAIDRVFSIFARAGDPDPPFPPAELYSEGWMLRLVMDSHSNGLGGLRIPVTDQAAWYSEARLASPFQPSRRGDPNGEGITHADGVVGQFTFRDETTAGFELNRNAIQFAVIEAKMGSKLAAGTTRVRWYDQAVRNAAAMAWTIYRGESSLDSIEFLDFVVVAPQVRIDNEPSFEAWTDEASIADKVARRIELYGADDLQRRDDLRRFRTDLFDPFLDRLNIHLVSWEDALNSVAPAAAEPLSDFYGTCLVHNRVS